MKRWTLKIACIQMNSGEDALKNCAKATAMIRNARKDGAELVCLPEVFNFRGAKKRIAANAESLSGRWIRSFRALAKEEKVSILLGSFLEKSNRPDRFYNTSVLISKEGRLAAFYRKIHLFELAGSGSLKASEARYILPGREVKACRLSGIPFGFSICYDLRFPELFRKLSARGVCAIFVPSNFTDYTGRAHWEALLRARAIENQLYILAPAQSGKDPGTGMKSHGNSMIVSPWGDILARAGRDSEEIVFATLGSEIICEVRRKIPALKSRGAI
ncbi:MAG TPA: carbon-nitrogen hydrolase family protein [Candidatus Omnitrophota bacterium]|nr:carbon-nitrogen hydrolase family protein [Candidatus Omnitrophota bacterium]